MGEVLWLDAVNDCINLNIQAEQTKTEQESDNHDLENALAYVYQGYAGLICPYTTEMLSTNEQVLRIVYDRIVGQKVQTH